MKPVRIWTPGVLPLPGAVTFVKLVQKTDSFIALLEVDVNGDPVPAGENLGVGPLGIGICPGYCGTLPAAQEQVQTVPIPFWHRLEKAHNDPPPRTSRPRKKAR